MGDTKVIGELKFKLRVGEHEEKLGLGLVVYDEVKHPL